MTTSATDNHPSPYFVRVASCGCVYRRNSGEELELCEMVCNKHKDEFILHLYNEYHINRQLS